MAEGPHLPRKGTALTRSREAIQGVAYQIGVLLAIQRNRFDITQWELGQEVGIDQLAISNVENGKSGGLTGSQVDALFNRLDLGDDTVQASFVKWWQDNAV